LTAETVELPVKNSEEFVNGSSLATFVIDDDMIELGSGGHFFASGSKTNLEIIFGVSGTGAESSFEGGQVGHGDENEQRLGNALAQCAGTLQVGANADDLALIDKATDLVTRDSAAMTVHVGVFKKAILGKFGIELSVAEEDLVNTVDLARSRRSGLSSDNTS
jgi:hypothetical protein